MVAKFTDTSERGLQKFITNHMVIEHHFIETTPAEFDRDFSINTKQVLAFIESTQKESYEMILKKGERSFLVRLDEKIKEQGVIEVLRKGVKHLKMLVFYKNINTA